MNSWYAYVKAQPCLTCGATQAEAAHLQPYSDKLRGFTRRSHKDDIAAYYCIPLCASCHRGVGGIHDKAEGTWLDDNLPGGRAAAYAWVVRHLLLWREDGP